jgi:hypothetical protein
MNVREVFLAVFSEFSGAVHFLPVVNGGLFARDGGAGSAAARGTVFNELLSDAFRSCGIQAGSRYLFESASSAEKAAQYC